MKAKQHKIFNVYSPPDRDLSLYRIVGESFFSWRLQQSLRGIGYEEADRRGEEAEDWQVADGLVLLNDPDDPPTSFSRWWLSSTTPDLAFATNDLPRIASRTVLSQLGGSHHKPIKVSLDLQYKPQRTSKFTRWNYKKANWQHFFESDWSVHTDQQQKAQPEHQNQGLQLNSPEGCPRLHSSKAS